MPKLKPDSGNPRYVACRCSQTPPLAAEVSASRTSLRSYQLLFYGHRATSTQTRLCEQVRWSNAYTSRSLIYIRSRLQSRRRLGLRACLTPWGRASPRGPWPCRVLRTVRGAQELMFARLGCLHSRLDCFRVERTSSRAGVSPAEVQRLSRRTVSPTIVDGATQDRWQPQNAMILRWLSQLSDRFS